MMRFGKVVPVLALSLLSACASSPGDQEAKKGSAIRPGFSNDHSDMIIGDRVFFEMDHADLSDVSRALLDRQVKWLKQYAQTTVTIEGHADERGTREYNFALGERRANAVRNYLVASGINPARIKVVSYGKERPAVSGSTEEIWAQNRRGVTVVD